jgi:hypothetical protein
MALDSDDFLRIPESVLNCFSCDVAERSLDREQQHGRQPDQILRKAVQEQRWFLKGDTSESRIEPIRKAVEDYVTAMPVLEVPASNKEEENVYWSQVHTATTIQNLLLSSGAINRAVNTTKRALAAAESREEKEEEESWQRSHLGELYREHLSK